MTAYKTGEMHNSLYILRSRQQKLSARNYLQSSLHRQLKRWTTNMLEITFYKQSTCMWTGHRKIYLSIIIKIH